MNRSQSYSKASKKTTLKFVKGSQPQSSRLRQGGVSPSAEMQAGQYKVMCEAGRVATKWGKPVVELAFRIIEGEHFGVHVPGWIPIHMVNDVVCPCKYTEQCAVVLGHEVEPGEDIDPESVFVGKLLLVEVKFRATDGKSRSLEDSTRKKDERDFLRVSSVLGVAEL